MGLQKTKTLSNGTEGNYWSIGSIGLTQLKSTDIMKLRIDLHLWKDKESKDTTGSTPLDQQNFSNIPINIHSISDLGVLQTDKSKNVLLTDIYTTIQEIAGREQVKIDEYLTAFALDNQTDVENGDAKIAFFFDAINV